MALASEAPEIVNIDGQSINIASQDDLVRRMQARMRAGRGFSVFTLNLDHLVKRRADEEFRQIYARATFVTADGVPLLGLARKQGKPVGLATGSDLIDPLCAMAAREGLPLYFYGSTRDMLEGAAAALVKRHPGLKIAGCEAPPFGLKPRSAEVEAAGERMAASGAKICLVALGAPRQEQVGDFLFAKHPGIGFLCIGAALDFVAGGQVRAPSVFRKAGVEWLWRLATNPRRMFMRYLRCAVLLQDLTRQARAPLPR